MSPKTPIAETTPGSAALSLTWLGAAGFFIQSGKTGFLIDPFISRSQAARPSVRIPAENLTDASAIFITHGHFDHVIDVPELVEQGNATVYCTPATAGKLADRGVPKDLVVGVVQGDRFELDGFTAEPFTSRHVTFDRELVISTLKKGGFSFLKQWRLITGFPTGGVLSWRFKVGSKMVHHFGSGGSTDSELAQFTGLKTDILLVPLQGRTDICIVAQKYVETLKPDMVIPHHHDDFHPPISSLVDIEPFISGIKSNNPRTKIIVPVLNEKSVIP